VLAELARPLSYLSIHHPTRGIQVVNWWLPVGLASSICICGGLANGPIDLFGSSGALSKILGFIQSLPGFYLAALAAVATFNNPDMDKLMPGTPPTAKILYNGTLTVVPLTRRRMLSIMFAYLTAISFILTLLTIGAMTFAEPIRSVVAQHCATIVPFVKCAFSFTYFVALGQMLFITMWGLFYLGERIHTPD
jgi:hypothetical protein